MYQIAATVVVPAITRVAQLDSGDFGLMSSRVIQEIRKMPEHHRYLRGAALLGAAAIGLAVLCALYAVYVRFWLHAPQGFTALIVAITFLSGVNLFFLGIIGEYVGRVYEEAKARHHYVVRKVISYASGDNHATTRSVVAAENTGTNWQRLR